MERDVERLVHENQKLVHFQVNRYLQRYFVGDMEREDAEELGVSRQGVYVRQRQALRQLRAALSIAITGGAP